MTSLFSDFFEKSKVPKYNFTPDLKAIQDPRERRKNTFFSVSKISENGIDGCHKIFCFALL